MKNKRKAAIALILTAILMIPGTLFASQPPAAEEPWLTVEERIYGLSLIWRYSAEMFAKWDILPSGFDWDALYIEYLSKVIDARDIVEYYMLLMSFAAYLESKSFVGMPEDTPMFRNPIMFAWPVEGRFIIIAVNEGLTNIPLGSEIISVDDMPPLEYLEKNYGGLFGQQTPLYREAFLTHFLSVSFNSKDMSIEAITPEGETIEEAVAFVPLEDFAGWDLRFENVSYPHVSSRKLLSIAVYVHENGIHRIIIPSFWESIVFNSVSNYIRSVQDTAAGFILDVRGNSGGFSSPEILHHFIDVHELN